MEYSDIDHGVDKKKIEETKELDEKAYEDILYERMKAIEKRIKDFEKITGIPLTEDAQNAWIINNFVSASAILATGKGPISKILSKILLKMAEFAKLTAKNDAFFRFLFSYPKQYRESLIPIDLAKKYAEQEQIKEMKQAVEEYMGRSLGKETPVEYGKKVSNSLAKAFTDNTKEFLQKGYGVSIDGGKYITDPVKLNKELQNTFFDIFITNYNDTMKDIQSNPDKAIKFLQTLSKNIEKMDIDIPGRF